MQPLRKHCRITAAAIKSSSSECFRNVSPIRSSCPFQSLCENRHAASTQAAMITIHRYEKVLSFTHFSVIGTASISKTAKYKRYPKTSSMVTSAFIFSIRVSRLPAQKNPAAPGSVRQLPVSAPAFHTFSPASLARIPIATFSGVIGSSLTRTPVAL